MPRQWLAADYFHFTALLCWLQVSSAKSVSLLQFHNINFSREHFFSEFQLSCNLPPWSNSGRILVGLPLWAEHIII